MDQLDMTILDERPRHPWIRFSPEVSVGHILTFVSLVAAAMGAWINLDRRITVVEQKVPQLQAYDATQDKQNREAIEQLHDDIRDLKLSVQSLNTILLTSKLHGTP